MTATADTTAIRSRIGEVDEATRNGGLAVVSALAAHGVDTVFGIPGTHNLEFYRHLERFGIRAITPRHEQGAGYGADGYHLVTGRPGVVITTSGPGLTNVITAAATAYAESRPMLILSPGVPTGLERSDVGMLHETKDSSGALTHLLVSSRRARTAEGAAQAVADAFALFASERPGPVHIEVPLDVLEGPWHGTVAAPKRVSLPTIDSAALAQAAEALSIAQRPLVVAGGGARAASAELTALVERLDAPIATTANGKGIVAEDHPLSLGANVRFASVQEESREADVLLVVGTEIADSDLWGGLIGAQGEDASHQTVVRCDIDPDQLHKNLRGDVLVCADAREFCTALLDALTAADSPAADEPAAQRGRESSGAERADALRARQPEDFDPELIGARITRLVQEACGEEAIIAGDSSQVTYDGSVHALTARTPGQLLYMPGYATLGYGIPAAIGAKLGAPEKPVVCLVGDGAAMFAIQEIVTAVELALPIPFVIVDNGGYAEIEHQMRTRDIEPFAVRLTRPDFAALGRAMGAEGATITGDGLGGLVDAVRTALAADGPTVIHVFLPGA